MKKLVLLLSIFTTIGVVAQPPNVPAKKGARFGAKVTAKGAITADQIATAVTDTNAVAVKVKGTVVEVCKAEGCWIRMKTADGNMLIRMKDHKFLVPLVLNGKTIVAEGTARIKETSVEMLKHFAEDAGKSKEEIDAIKEPKKEIVMQATGILVL